MVNLSGCLAKSFPDVAYGSLILPLHYRMPLGCLHTAFRANQTPTEQTVINITLQNCRDQASWWSVRRPTDQSEQQAATMSDHHHDYVKANDLIRLDHAQTKASLCAVVDRKRSRLEGHLEVTVARASSNACMWRIKPEAHLETRWQTLDHPFRLQNVATGSFLNVRMLNATATVFATDAVVDASDGDLWIIESHRNPNCTPSDFQASFLD